MLVPERPSRSIAEDDGAASAECRTCASPYHAQVKVVHRGVPDVEVSTGNHDAYGPGLVLIREWIPFDVLHFPLRTRAQLERKFRNWSVAPSGRHHTEALERLADGVDVVYVESLRYGPSRVEEGLEDGSLTTDTRLRTLLRALDHGVARLDPWAPSLADEVALADELQVVLKEHALDGPGPTGGQRPSSVPSTDSRRRSPCAPAGRGDRVRAASVERVADDVVQRADVDVAP